MDSPVTSVAAVEQHTGALLWSVEAAACIQWQTVTISIYLLMSWPANLTSAMFHWPSLSAACSFSFSHTLAKHTERSDATLTEDMNESTADQSVVCRISSAEVIEKKVLVNWQNPQQAKLKVKSSPVTLQRKRKHFMYLHNLHLKCSLWQTVIEQS